MALSEANAKIVVCFVLCTAVLVVCFVVISIYSGFEHEPNKFRTTFVTMILTVLFQMLVWEPIRFIVLAIDHATWPQPDEPYTAEKGKISPSHFTYLKTRLQGLRSELQTPEIHRDEALNQKYKRIAHDLMLYGSYFVTLMMVVLVGEDSNEYYNTSIMTRLFKDNTSTTMGLSAIYFSDQIPDFLKITMVRGFHANRSVYGYEGWWAMEQWSRMGVVRLRQLRTEKKHIGLEKPVWANTTYAPEWRLPYHRLHYTDKFWLIYDPFKPISMEIDFLDWLLLKFDREGELLSYPEIAGYEALLENSKVDALKQVDYLRASKWIDRHTCALFIDFTLYNVDANVFTTVTLVVENTPFGTQLHQMDVDCVSMLGSPGQFTKLELIVLVLYIILMVTFMLELLTKLWYDPKVIRDAWNLVDVFLCLLNVIMMTLWIVNEVVTRDILEKVKLSSKAEYLRFHRPMRLEMMITIVKGFLVCLTTLRLWKVLQFADVFQHFTRTLSAAWQAVLSLAVIIVVLLMGIGIALAVPNGNNAMVFRHVIQAVVTCLWYSVGFNGGVKPAEFFHGGMILGLLLYLVLVFLVAIILMNVFAAVIYDYFEVTGRDLKEQRRHKRLSFVQFLRAEYAHVLRRCPGSCLSGRSAYRSHNRTVAQNVALQLDKQEQKEQKEQQQLQLHRIHKPKHRPTDAERHADYLRRVRRTFSLMAVLEVQMELLDRLLLGDEVGNLPTPPESGSEDEDFPEMYSGEERPPKKKY